MIIKMYPLFTQNYVGVLAIVTGKLETGAMTSLPLQCITQTPCKSSVGKNISEFHIACTLYDLVLGMCLGILCPKMHFPTLALARAWLDQLEVGHDGRTHLISLLFYLSSLPP